MVEKILPTVIRRLASTDSSLLLDRVDSQSEAPLTKTQALVDGIVSHSLAEVSQPSLMTALLGANFVSRLTRIGFMSAASSLLTEASAILSPLARGGSCAIALANESAAFAGMEKGFARLQGHSSSQPFQKDWARAAISLGSLKLFGKLAEGENLILRHVMADLGMVMGQQGASALGMRERPQGSFAQQMMEAEAMNLSMEGSLALLHGLSPSLHATERSLDFYLKGRGPLLSSGGRFSPGLVLEGGPEGFLTGSREAEEIKESYIWKAKKDETSKDLGEHPGPPRLLDEGTAFERKLLRSSEGDGLSDEALTWVAARLARGSLVSPAIRRFVETALETSDPNEQRSAIKVLATLENLVLRSEILAVVLNWPDPGVQRSAAQVLAELGDRVQFPTRVYEAQGFAAYRRILEHRPELLETHNGAKIWIDPLDDSYVIQQDLDMDWVEAMIARAGRGQAQRIYSRTIGDHPIAPSTRITARSDEANRLEEIPLRIIPFEPFRDSPPRVELTNIIAMNRGGLRYVVSLENGFRVFEKERRDYTLDSPLDPVFFPGGPTVLEYNENHVSSRPMRPEEISQFRRLIEAEIFLSSRGERATADEFLRRIESGEEGATFDLLGHEYPPGLLVGLAEAGDKVPASDRPCSDADIEEFVQVLTEPAPSVSLARHIVSCERCGNEYELTRDLAEADHRDWIRVAHRRFQWHLFGRGVLTPKSLEEDEKPAWSEHSLIRVYEFLKEQGFF